MRSTSKKTPRVRPVAERLEDYRLSLGLTWKQVAERLKLSVPMLMQVRSGLRNMSALALHRLEAAEDAAQIESRARKVVDDLLDDRGSARELIEKYCSGTDAVEMPLKYRRITGAADLPKKIRLKQLSDDERERLILIFRRTLEPRVLILACIEESQRDERIFAAITRRCFEDLQEFAFRSVFGSAWMTAVSRIAMEASEETQKQPDIASGQFESS